MFANIDLQTLLCPDHVLEHFYVPIFLQLAWLDYQPQTHEWHF
jgi:hypothetical protein